MYRGEESPIDVIGRRRILINVTMDGGDAMIPVIGPVKGVVHFIMLTKPADCAEAQHDHKQETGQSQNQSFQDSAS